MQVDYPLLPPAVPVTRPWLVSPHQDDDASR
jgi:hypothetical protein